MFLFVFLVQTGEAAIFSITGNSRASNWCNSRRLGAATAIYGCLWANAHTIGQRALSSECITAPCNAIWAAASKRRGCWLHVSWRIHVFAPPSPAGNSCVVDNCQDKIWAENRVKTPELCVIRIWESYECRCWFILLFHCIIKTHHPETDHAPNLTLMFKAMHSG